MPKSSSTSPDTSFDEPSRGRVTRLDLTPNRRRSGRLSTGPARRHRQGRRGGGARAAAIGASIAATLAVCASLLPSSAGALGPGSACLPPSATTASSQNSGAIDFSRSLNPQGALYAIMLFVDYPDRAGTASTTDIFNRRVPRATQWFGAVSYGRMSLEVTPVHQWFRMPQASTQYYTSAGLSFDSQRRLILDAVAAADQSVDFQGYQLIYVVSPSGSGFLTSPAFTPQNPFFGVTADGNRFTHGATLGNDFYSTSDAYGSSTLVHETGHTFGLPDLWDFNRTVFPFSTFVGEWDVMGSLGVGAGFLAWQRLQLGWIEGSQLACLTAPETLDMTLSPLQVGGGTKAIILPTSPSTFTVAEYRQATAEDARLCDNGLLVYTVDTTVDSGHGSIRVKPAAPDDGTKSVATCGPLYNAAYSRVDPPFVAGSLALKVLCPVGADLLVRVAFGVPLSTERNPLCPIAPGVPTGVLAVADDALATVSWQPPADDGGRPILNYIVTPFVGAVAKTPVVVGAVESTTVAGLTNGTSYTFKVSAVNSVGAGILSTASNVVTPISQVRSLPEPPAAVARPVVPDPPEAGVRRPPPGH
jgi:M6 family metalloprotease-like protein